MLSPDYIEDLPIQVTELYSLAELEIIKDIARRISKEGYLTPTGLWQMQRLKEIGSIENDIIKQLSAITDKAEDEITRTYDAAIAKSMEYDNAIHKEAGKTIIPIAENKALLQIIAAGLETTQGLFVNLTSTTANSGGKQLERILDLAYTEVVSGAFTYDHAIRKAIKTMSAQGITAVIYEPSGIHTPIDVVVRRSTLTGVNQATDAVSTENCRQQECDVVEVSAHSGARNTGSGHANHADWQGKLYSLSGTEYPNYRAETGAGKVDGLGGANCRHSKSPFYAGISKRAYSQAKIDEYNAKVIPYDGQKIARAQADMIQRHQEREIRKWKREAAGLYAGGHDDTKAKAKVAEWQLKQREFIKETGLKRDYTRERAGKQYVSDHENHKITDASIEKVPVPKAELLTPEQNKELQKAQRELLETMRDKPPGTEGSRIYNMDMKGMGESIGTSGAGNVIGKRKTQKAFISIHNHPESDIFSPQDLKVFINDPNMSIMTVVGNDGSAFLVEKLDMLDSFDAAGFIKFIEKVEKENPFNTVEETIAGMRKIMQGAKKYGYHFEE